MPSEASAFPRLLVRGLARAGLFGPRDLDLPAGRVLVLHGPTGSGKTLFLRAIADLDPVDEGRVALDGVSREAIPAPAWRRRVLYVHQRGVRLPGTVAGNVACVAALGPEPIADPPPPPGLATDQDADRLSGGEAQALALHRALLLEPAVLLLDESTSAMDPALARGWEERLGAFAATGASILWVAHDEALADRVGATREAFP